MKLIPLDGKPPEQVRRLLEECDAIVYRVSPRRIYALFMEDNGRCPR